MALYQLKMHHLEREGHRPKHGEGGQDVEKKIGTTLYFERRGKITEGWERMKFKRPEKSTVTICVKAFGW
jgi:hypothetical protein